MESYNGSRHSGQASFPPRRAGRVSWFKFLPKKSRLCKNSVIVIASECFLRARQSPNFSVITNLDKKRDCPVFSIPLITGFPVFCSALQNAAEERNDKKRQIPH